MAQLRHHANGGATALPWSTLQDPNLSFTARGILSYALSLPPGWQFSAERIAASTPNQGKAAVLSALRELEEAGYRRIVKERGEGGRFSTVAEFAFSPVPEWIEEYQAKLTAKDKAKRPGPKKLSKPAKASAKADQQERMFPQVAPEVEKPESGESDSGQPVGTDVSAGRTGSRETGIRNPALSREGYTERDTHTSPAAKAKRDVVSDEDGDGVCVESSAENGHIDAQAKTVATTVLHASVPETPRGRLGQADREQLQYLVAACLRQGHSAQVIERRTRGLCNDHTLKPMAHLSKALKALESESPATSGVTPTPGNANASKAPSAPRQRQCARGADCMDGQLRCGQDCPTTCAGRHNKPLGGACPSCGSGEARTVDVAGVIAAAFG